VSLPTPNNKPQSGDTFKRFNKQNNITKVTTKMTHREDAIHYLEKAKESLALAEEPQKR